MARIYDEASCALVWLGLPSDDRREARAIDFLTEMASLITRPKRGGPTFSDLYITEKTSSRWLNLLGFCTGCDYWTRTWIIQEFLQARHIEIICGTAQLDWTFFATVYTQLQVFGREGRIPPGSLQDSILPILSSVPGRLTAMRLSGQATPLQGLLHEFYDAQCSEPRDKVYGMLGIAEDCGTHPETGLFRGPQPDYATHILDVYQAVVNYLRDTSSTMSVSPLTILLLQKSLHISKLDVLEYVAQFEPADWQTRLAQSTFALRPSYIGVIEDTLPGWTGIRDLRQSLEQFDWSKYVGYTIEKRPSRPNKLTSPPVAPPMSRSSSSTQQRVENLPNNMISSVLAVAEVHPGLATLYQYLPQAQGFHLPAELLTLHHEDKAALANPPNQKPTVIIEQSEAASPLRIGFACAGARRGDVICQWPETDLTLIARRPVYGSQSLQLVGRAVMVTHSGLAGREMETHPVCGKNIWTSACLSGDVGLGEYGGELLETDAVSMFEILRGGEM